MVISSEKNIFFFINRARKIQSLWRGYTFRKEMRYHMTCDSCGNPEIILNYTERNEYLNDTTKIWHKRCKNCLASYDEQKTKFILCVQHIGFAPCGCCAELDFQRQILEDYDLNKKRNRNKRWH